MKKRLVVIGNGMAGMRTVEELLAANPNSYNITVFGAEPYGNYNRIMLSPVLCGEKTVADIMINDRHWYEEHQITLHAGEEKTVVQIDRKQQRVFAKDGTVAYYDKLLIATGSNPFILPVPGHDLQGVIAFRGIFDVTRMLNYTKTHRHAIVLGGGLLGLEAANGLASQGMQVTVLHNSSYLLNRQLDQTAAELLQEELERRGIEFKLQAKTQALHGNAEGHVQRIELADGSILPCDLFVMAIGVQPNFSLAQQAGIHCERGIVVNDTMQTFDPSIYAVGECVQHRGQTFGLVAPVFEQAKVCANHLSEHGVAEYKTLPTATKLKVSGIQLFSVGDFNGDAACDFIHFHDRELNVYKRLVIRNECLIGVVLYGDTSDGAWFHEQIEQQTNIRPIRSALVFGKAYAETILNQTLASLESQPALTMEVA